MGYKIKELRTGKTYKSKDEFFNEFVKVKPDMKITQILKYLDEHKDQYEYTHKTGTLVAPTVTTDVLEPTPEKTAEVKVKKEKPVIKMLTVGTIKCKCGNEFQVTGDTLSNCKCGRWYRGTEFIYARNEKGHFKKDD